MEWQTRDPPPFCEDCKAPCSTDFKKVLSLKNSGLVYLPKNNDLWVPQKVTDVGNNENYILQNPSHKNLRKPDIINELCGFKTKCFKCKNVIQKVRSLIDEISDIRGNEILGVCKHCRKANLAGNCKKCEFIVNKYLKDKMKQYEDRQSRFKTWLCKVKSLLQALLESERVCRHKMYRDSSTIELEKLLWELKSPLSMRELDIEFFPTMESEKLQSLETLSQSKDMLEELIIQLKCEKCRRYASDDSVYVSPSKATPGCICKYFKDKKLEERRSMEVLTKVTSTEKEKAHVVKQISKGSIKRTTGDEKQIKQKISKEIKEIRKEMLPKDGKKWKENLPSGENKNKEKPCKLEKVVKELPNKVPLTEEQLLLKMLKERQKMKVGKEKSFKQEKVKQLPKIAELPTFKVNEKVEMHEEKSESVIECGDQKSLQPKDMIQGSNIVNLDERHKCSDTNEVKPLFFKVQAVCPEPVVAQHPSLHEANNVTAKDKLQSTKHDKQDSEEDPLKGIIRYQLSNLEFVDKGWTKLPTTKTMRMMSVYKMKPANPKNDWFERHKHTKMMFYDSGEKLAEVDDDGYGKWYYKNGIVALDYYSAKESNVGRRYVIYSSGMEFDNGKNNPVTVLASFDYLGNGVVYDHYGNERLKYNQSEGMVFDDKVAPPGRWKWHTLNDPPVLQQVFIDTHVKCRDPCIDRFLKNHNTDNNLRNPPDAEILAIELKNFAKDRAQKLLQKFKPFEIRMKALKLNEQFSLRILDQGNIYLLFRHGPICLKLNLGMVLISDEIVDTDVAEVFHVATPYDRNPPRTDSVADIQAALKQAQKIGKTRVVNRFELTSSRISKCSS